MITKNKNILHIVSSEIVAVSCLLLIIVIVIWGTLYEVSEGLFAARERFFESWFILTSFYLPLPGLKSLSLVLTINLITHLLRFSNKPIRNSGIIMIHLGAILLLFGVLFSSQFNREYFLPLEEGDSASSAYNTEQSEIALFKKIDAHMNGFITIDSLSTQNIKAGKEISFPNAGLLCHVLDITKQADSDKDEIIPVLQLRIIPGQGCGYQKEKEIIIKSGDLPVEVNCRPEPLYIGLRPVSVSLPIRLHLLDFSECFHRGTETLKEVTSRISIHDGKIDREAVISMNKPLQYGSYTFYQSSFSHQGDRKTSILSVVYNPYRFFPYISGTIIMGGFILYFVSMIIRRFFELKAEHKHETK